MSEELNYQAQLEQAAQALEAVGDGEQYDRDILLGRHAAVVALAASGLETGEHDQLKAIGIKLAATRQAANIASAKGDALLEKNLAQTAQDYQSLVDFLTPDTGSTYQATSGKQTPKKRAATSRRRKPASTSASKTGGAKSDKT